MALMNIIQTMTSVYGICKPVSCSIHIWHRTSKCSTKDHMDMGRL